MVVPNFVPGDLIRSDWMNNVSRPEFAQTPNRAGHIPLVTDEAMSQDPSALLARSNQFLAALLTTPVAESLDVIVGAGTVILADGSPANVPRSQVSLPASAATYLWISPAGQITQGSTRPTDGSVLISRVTTDAAAVTQVDDLRPRFAINDFRETPPHMIAELVPVVYLPPGPLWTDERGWKWIVRDKDVFIAKGGVSAADVASDELFLLYERLWLTPETRIYSDTARVTRGATAQEDWNAGRLALIRDMAGHAVMGSGSASNGVDYLVDQKHGEFKHTMTERELAQHGHIGSANPAELDDRVNPRIDGNLFNDQGNDGAKYGDIVDSKDVTFELNILDAGESEPFNIVQPSYVATWLMFTGVRAT